MFSFSCSLVLNPWDEYLDAVAKRPFEPEYLSIRRRSQRGKCRREIYSSLYGYFVFIGGCGAALCLITAPL